jgi:hypothetical protein
MHLCTQYSLKALCCASWTEARVQEHCASLLWSVRTLVQTLCTQCMGSLSMPARASYKHLCAQYFLRALFCASWMEARAQEHCASLLWSVRTLMQTLCTQCMGSLSMSAHASNMHLCAQYFLRALFCASWTEARAQEHCANLLWSVQTLVHTVCGFTQYPCVCIKYAPVRTICSESCVLCVLDGRARAEAWHKPAVVYTDTCACTVWCVGVLIMPARASNIHLCAQYFLRAVFCASWTEAHVQEHFASLLWSVQTLVHTLSTRCVGSLSMPAPASNMHLCTHYFLGAVFCASWMDAHVQEHCASLLWSVQTLVPTLCTRCLGSLTWGDGAVALRLPCEV